MLRKREVYNSKGKPPNRCFTLASEIQLIGHSIGVFGCGKPDTGVRRVVHRVKTLSKDQQVSNCLQRKQDQRTGNNNRS